MYLLKILFIIILILFPFGELLRYDFNNHIALKPLDIMVVITAFVGGFTFKKIKQIRSFWYLGFFPLIGLVALLLNITWLYPQELLVSFFYLLRWIAYAMLFIIVLQFDTKFKKVITIFLFIDGLLILFLGYLQYFFYNSLKNLFYLGWDEHMHRIFSTFLDPNFVGIFYVLFFFFVGGIFWKNHKMHLSSIRSWLWFFILLLTFLATFMTFSRGALLSLIIGSLVFLSLLGKKKMIIVVISAVIFFGLIASPQFNDENMNLFRKNSGLSRIGNYATALMIIRDRPIFGVGFNSYRYTKRLYNLNYEWTKAPSHADAGVDNSWLFVLATTGIVGLISYIYLWKTILQQAIQHYKKRMSIGAIVVISSSSALFVNAMFINSLFFAPLMLWMWLMIGLMEEY